MSRLIGRKCTVVEEKKRTIGGLTSWSKEGGGNAFSSSDNVHFAGKGGGGRRRNGQEEGALYLGFLWRSVRNGTLAHVSCS